MEIKRFVLGPLQTNTYLLIEDDKAILIDPASKAEKLIEVLQDLKLEAILLTHGHFDHIKAVDGLYEKYHCPIYMNLADEPLARDKHSGKDFGLVSYITCPINNIEEGDINISSFEFKTIYTPGHTMGSVIYVFDDAIFTGDTLFKGSVGRTDLFGGDNRLLKDSLRVFKQFNKDYLIYPGHEESSQLSLELAYNPFLQ